MNDTKFTSKQVSVILSAVDQSVNKMRVLADPTGRGFVKRFLMNMDDPVTYLEKLNSGAIAWADNYETQEPVILFAKVDCDEWEVRTDY